MTEEDLFHAALAKSRAERAAFLDQACSGNSQLRAAVEALLAAHEAPGSLLNLNPNLPDAKPSGDGQAATLDSGVAAEEGHAATGEHISSSARPQDARPFQTVTADYRREVVAGVVIGGRYTLQEKIGEGGMGEVWVAKQTESVKRKVALKLIKTGMDSRAVLQRFEQERQALALMDHPNIARVLDGGMTPTGQPYFVMELVNGLPLTRFCDEAKLNPRERLELFVPICQAVQHAHQKGIVHRDLKPANILVTMIDGKPVPKVIDFGVAKATSGKLTEETMSTGFGAVVGTLEYMSPEQAGFSGEDIDTRADIYSLGVILYELLTGLRPIDAKRLRQAALTEMLRIIQEEEPSKPSTRLSTDESLPSLAALRQTEPKKLMLLLRGELDWVVMKCLEKQRDRRYETANGLARDIQRYLADEIVEARPPSTGYRLQKFIHRHKGQVIAASLVLFALLAGIVGTTVGLFEARRQEAIAQNEAKAKEQALVAAQDQRQKAEDNAREAVAAKERESAQRAKAERAYARTADVLDTMVSEVTGDSLATQKTISEEQKKFLNEVLTYYQEFVESAADDEMSRLRTARAAHQVSSIEHRLGRQEEALAAIRNACDGFAALAADFPVEPKYREMLALSHNNRGTLLMQLGKVAEAEEQHLGAVGIQEKLVAEFPDNPGYRQGSADSRRNLGNLLRGQAKGPQAVEQYRQALAIDEKLAADFPADSDYRQGLASSQNNLAAMLSELGQQREAEDRYREAQAVWEKLTIEFPSVSDYRQELATNHTNLGNLLQGQARGTQAEEQYRLALTIFEKLTVEFPAIPDHRRDLASGYNALGTLLRGLGREPEGEELYRQALAIQEKLAEEYPAILDYRHRLAMSHMNLGHLLKGQGESPKAEEQYRQALAVFEKLTVEFPAIPDYRWELANGYNALGSLLGGVGRGSEGEEQYRQALAIQTKLAEEYPANLSYRQDLAMSHTNLSQLLADEGKRLEAETLGRQGLAIWEKLAADFPDNPGFRQSLGVTCSNRGIQLAQWGKQKESEEQFRQALAIQEKLTADFPAVPEYRQELARSHMNLGNLLNMPTGGLWGLLGGRKKGLGAEEQFRQALAIQEKLAADFPDIPVYRQELAKTHNNLGILLAQQGKKPDAEEQYRAALAIEEKLATDFPAVPAYRISLGGTYCNYGLSAVERPARLEWFTKAIRTLTPIYEREPNNTTVRQFLENSHTGRAVCHFELEHHAEAVADWNQVLEFNPQGLHPMLLAARTESLVQVGQVAEAVAEVDKLTKTPFWPSGIYYNFACVYAIASDRIPDMKDKYGDQAMDCLRKALGGGFKDADLIEKDADLDPLRDRDDFKQLVGSLMADSAPN